MISIQYSLFPLHNFYDSIAASSKSVPVGSKQRKKNDISKYKSSKNQLEYFLQFEAHAFATVDLCLRQGYLKYYYDLRMQLQLEMAHHQ